MIVFKIVIAATLFLIGDMNGYIAYSEFKDDRFLVLMLLRILLSLMQYTAAVVVILDIVGVW